MSSSMANHKRSKSFPDKSGLEQDNLEAYNRVKLDKGHSKNCMNAKKNHLPNGDFKNSLRDEILQLEKRLDDQVCVRGALEQALGYRCSSHNVVNHASIPKPATELIKDIAVLEYEVSHLEQYLLSLYRKAFDQQISRSSPLTLKPPLITPKPPLITPRGKHLETSRADISLQPDRGFEENEVLVSGVQHCHSSVTRTSPSKILGKTLRACQSQPPSMMEYVQTSSSNIISLAEHLGTRISDHVLDTPNKISEDMIKCMSAIYVKLADPPGPDHGLDSPTSSLSSMTAFSPKPGLDMTWGPGFRQDSLAFNGLLDNPFHVHGLKEFSGPYSTMVEVQFLYKDNHKLGEVEDMLEHFRLLVLRLEEVNAKKLKHEEKLAFWINVHNALVMHAVLAYGIPQNNMKRVFLLLKAAYNVGGHIVSVDVIQSSILGCRISRPGQWLRLLLSSRTKLRAGDERQAYAIDHPEPLLHFALCSGCHSDPAIRVYTAKRVIQELETAKEEFIRATFGIAKDQRILLPKIIENFGKDSGLCAAGVIEMIQICLPGKFRKSIKKHLGKSRKKIEWVPHDFSFRYLISKELVK